MTYRIVELSNQTGPLASVLLTRTFGEGEEEDSAGVGVGVEGVGGLSIDGEGAVWVGDCGLERRAEGVSLG